MKQKIGQSVKVTVSDYKKEKKENGSK